MENASSMTSRGWQHNFIILTIALLMVLGAVFGLALPCDGNPTQLDTYPGRPAAARGQGTPLTDLSVHPF